MHFRETIAALPIAVLLFASSSIAQTQDNAAVAQQRYSRGVERFEAADFNAALDEFRAAHALSGSPNAQLFVARTLAQLGDDARAAAAYELAIHEAEDGGVTNARYADTRTAAQTELAQLEPRIGRVIIRVENMPGDARVHVGDRDIPHEWLGVAVAYAPGPLHLEIAAANRVPESRDVVVHAGERQEVDITLQDPPPPPPIVVTPRARPASRTPVLRIAWITSGGVALAGLVTFTTLAIVTNGHYQTLRARCADAPCPDDAAADVALGRTLQTWTDVSLGITAAAAVTGAVLFVADRRSSARVRIGVGPASIGVAGAF